MKPILFNTEMVRAILDGRKTVTRRAIQLPNGMTGRPVGEAGNKDNPLGMIYPNGIKRPPYQPGEILYARETWAAWSRTEGSMPSLHYKADNNAPDGIKWQPSIHMPRGAARIFLCVTDVGIERLQDMTCDDILAEGVIPKTVTGGQWQQWQRDYMRPVWDSTVKPADRDKYGWSANPWVWVIEFERISEGEAELETMLAQLKMICDCGKIDWRQQNERAET